MTPRLITDAALPPAPPADDELAQAIFILRQRLSLIAAAVSDLADAIGRARGDLAKIERLAVHFERLARGTTPHA